MRKASSFSALWKSVRRKNTDTYKAGCQRLKYDVFKCQRKLRPPIFISTKSFFPRKVISAIVIGTCKPRCLGCCFVLQSLFWTSTSSFSKLRLSMCQEPGTVEGTGRHILMPALSRPRLISPTRLYNILLYLGICMVFAFKSQLGEFLSRFL